VIHNHTNAYCFNSSDITQQPFDFYITTQSAMTNSSSFSGQYIYAVWPSTDRSTNEQQTINNFSYLCDPSVSGSIQNSQDFMLETTGMHDQRALQLYCSRNANEEPHSSANNNENPSSIYPGLTEETVIPKNQTDSIGMIHFPPYSDE
jgi:hypothetical protein